ncbi:hypothetical protein LA080_004837 [Diaporthe eres]|nr:hypothetical protein LA080_004837 [Diaporthe eres]
MTPSEKAPCKHSTARSNATQRDLGLLLLLLLLLTRPPSQPSHTGANETAGKPRSHRERPILPRFPAHGAAYWTDWQGNKRITPGPGPINLTPSWGNDHYLQAHHGWPGANITNKYAHRGDESLNKFQSFATGLLLLLPLLPLLPPTAIPIDWLTD